MPMPSEWPMPLPLPERLAPLLAQEASYLAASARISSFCWVFIMLACGLDAGSIVGEEGANHAGGTCGVTMSMKLRTRDAWPQVYLEAPEQRPAGVQLAPKTLVAFERVTLAPGEEREVTMHVAARSFMYWSVADSAWKTLAGSRMVRVGDSSRALPSSGRVE